LLLPQRSSWSVPAQVSRSRRTASSMLRRLIRPVAASLAGAVLVRGAQAYSSAECKLGPAPTPDLRFVSEPASDAANAVGSPAKYPVNLYPEIEPYEKGMLDVGDGHKL